MVACLFKGFRTTPIVFLKQLRRHDSYHHISSPIILRELVVDHLETHLSVYWDSLVQTTLSQEHSPEQQRSIIITYLQNLRDGEARGGEETIFAVSLIFDLRISVYLERGQRYLFNDSSTNPLELQIACREGPTPFLSLSSSHYDVVLTIPPVPSVHHSSAPSHPFMFSVSFPFLTNSQLRLLFYILIMMTGFQSRD